MEMHASSRNPEGKNTVNQENYDSEKDKNRNTKIIAEVHHSPNENLKDITNT